MPQSLQLVPDLLFTVTWSSNLGQEIGLATSSHLAALLHLQELNTPTDAHMINTRRSDYTAWVLLKLSETAQIKFDLQNRHQQLHC